MVWDPLLRDDLPGTSAYPAGHEYRLPRGGGAMSGPSELTQSSHRSHKLRQVRHRPQEYRATSGRCLQRILSPAEPVGCQITTVRMKIVA